MPPTRSGGRYWWSSRSVADHRWPLRVAGTDAQAEVSCVKCPGCGYWACLDYRIELDDNPEIDLNPE